MNSYIYCCVLNTLKILIVYAHGPRINSETGPAFILEVKKENSIKKRNTSTVTYAF